MKTVKWLRFSLSTILGKNNVNLSIIKQSQSTYVTFNGILKKKG